jgi:hypothetical protein
LFRARGGEFAEEFAAILALGRKDLACALLLFNILVGIKVHRALPDEPCALNK